MKHLDRYSHVGWKSLEVGDFAHHSCEPNFLNFYEILPIIVVFGFLPIITMGRNGGGW